MFTRAVKELDIIRNEAITKINEEKRRKTPQVALERLTMQEINDALQGNLTHWGIHKNGNQSHNISVRNDTENDKLKNSEREKMKTKAERKKKEEKEPTIKRYNLRKR